MNYNFFTIHGFWSLLIALFSLSSCWQLQHLYNKCTTPLKSHQTDNMTFFWWMFTLDVAWSGSSHCFQGDGLGFFSRRTSATQWAITDYLGLNPYDSLETCYHNFDLPRRRSLFSRSIAWDIILHNPCLVASDHTLQKRGVSFSLCRREYQMLERLNKRISIISWRTQISILLTNRNFFKWSWTFD